jgi:hypothetical protein
MRLSKQVEEHLRTIGHSADERARVLPALESYLERTSIPMREFARRIDYSPETLKQFRSNKYHNVAGTHRLLCRAIEQYIHANPIEPPTQVLGDLYETTNSRIIRQTIQKLLVRPTAYLIYGPPGSQKSFTLEYEIARLNREELPNNGHGRRAFYVYAVQGMRPTQLLKEIAIACGSSAHGDKSRIQRNLAWDFRGRRVLVAIDEAQNLGAEPKEWVSCLEAVRALLDRPPQFSLLLAGMHTLISKFNRYSASLGQWNDRIAGKKMLPGLTEEEARGIALREVPDISDRKITQAIELAKRTDAYNNEKPYINIRSLTGTLREIQILRQRES